MSFGAIILLLAIGTACAWIADRFIPGHIPGGIYIAELLGVTGGLIGSQRGEFGPSAFGLFLLPTLFASVLFVFGSALLCMSNQSIENSTIATIP